MENCFDGEFVFKYSFNAKWTREAIMDLETLGRLRYYDSFPRPMFNVMFSDGTTMKGVEGTEECRLIFARDKPEAAKKHFEEIFTEEVRSGTENIGCF
jgi:hypothetical protein